MRAESVVGGLDWATASICLHKRWGWRQNQPSNYNYQYVQRLIWVIHRAEPQTGMHTRVSGFFENPSSWNAVSTPIMGRITAALWSDYGMYVSEPGPISGLDGADDSIPRCMWRILQSFGAWRRHLVPVQNKLDNYLSQALTTNIWANGELKVDYVSQQTWKDFLTLGSVRLTACQHYQNT